MDDAARCLGAAKAELLPALVGRLPFAELLRADFFPLLRALLGCRAEEGEEEAEGEPKALSSRGTADGRAAWKGDTEPCSAMRLLLCASQKSDLGEKSQNCPELAYFCHTVLGPYSTCIGTHPTAVASTLYCHTMRY